MIELISTAQCFMPLNWSVITEGESLQSFAQALTSSGKLLQLWANPAGRLVITLELPAGPVCVLGVAEYLEFLQVQRGVPG